MPTTDNHAGGGLRPDDFAAFVNDIHGQRPGAAPDDPDFRGPFPWQRALLDRIITDGRWPDVIDVPTGLGKTSLLDVAVFVAALRPELGRRRIFFVVDRRLVVDEAHQHATGIADALRSPRSQVCARVADALRVPGDDAPGVLTVTRMRGGVTWDRIWLERPDRYAVITGTVDQVGSRLLFRGYGVSEYARSIDAALAGTDSLIVVDEAHLAAAFHTTLSAALDLDSWRVAARPVVVTMSATTSTDPSRTGQPTVTHRIGPDDETHPVAGRRLRARKRLRLVEVPTTRKRADVDVPAALAKLATTLVSHGVVGVVTNTVSRARAVFDLLDGRVEAILLTGRSRPIDRDLLLRRYYHRIRVDRDRSDSRPLVVVATQTIEVGANIDLDALVTESASLPALVQRLGRLNRLGLHDTPTPAYLVHDSSIDAADPVYGPARLAAWRWLADQAPVGTIRNLDAAQNGLLASPASLRTLVAAAPSETLAGPAPYVPLLTAGTLDAWTRTSPTPHPDPPVAPYLHGIDDAVPPVTVLWRTGLPFDRTDRWSTVLDLVPPVADESIDVPARQVRNWLLNQPAAEPIADVDIPETAQDEPEASKHQPEGTAVSAPRARDDDGRPLVLRYRRRGDAEIIPASAVRPGDTIVVPVQYGGADRYGWHPGSHTPVVDVADLAVRRRGPVVRIGPHLRELAGYVDSSRRNTDIRPGSSDAAPGDDVVPEALNNLIRYAADGPDGERPDGYPNLLATLVTATTADDPLHLVLTALSTGAGPAGARLTVTPTRQVDPATGAVWVPEFPIVLSATRLHHADDESEAASSATAYPGRRITLDAHQAAVAARAAEMAANLGLPARLAASVEAAARWHDEGKRDPRFQAMLFAGRRSAADLAPEPIAKSGLDPANRAEARRARDDAGYPPGMRHEALSAQIAVLRLADQPTDLDQELVLHLIASHHGRSRPLLPPIVDPTPIKVTVPGLPVLGTQDTVDWQAPARFADLNTTYGRWGLALLETVVRLADIWSSARDEEGTP